ncbi:MAG: STAS domain-containing protein [candidate division Zixibacteria bacterium]|nr:STAS domain-containing protein [candidate division Zixibacteria bacterium]
MFDITMTDDGSVSLVGRLDAAQARKAEEVLAKISSPLRIDFTGLEYISSGGLSVLLITYKRLSDQGHSLKLVNMSPHVREVFHYARLDKVFDIE